MQNRPPLVPLDELEVTLGELIFELLRLPETVSEYVLPQADANGSPSITQQRGAKMSASHAYVNALLALNYQPGCDELNAAANWFATRFRVGADFDLPEMNRVEALLQIAPQRDDLPQLLHWMLDQREMRDDQEQLAISGEGATAFSTLLGIRAQRMAKPLNLEGVSEKIETQRMLTTAIGRARERYIVEKDRALAIRLAYDLRYDIEAPLLAMPLKRTRKTTNGATKPAVVEPVTDMLVDVDLVTTLERLLAAAEMSGFWDARENLYPYIEQMRDGQFVAFNLDPNIANTFKAMIVSTSYVIENLAPLATDYPQIYAPLGEAMTLWWNAIKGKDVVTKLARMFAGSADYVEVLTRTIIATSAYYRMYGETRLRDKTFDYVARQGARSSPKQKGQIHAEAIESALRRWLDVTVRDRAKLTLGLSGADVYRVMPQVRSPLNPEGRELDLRSVVVKIGPISEIQRERVNYSRLPPSVVPLFVKMPKHVHINRRQHIAVVVMDDLYGHWTFHEALHKEVQLPKRFSVKLCDFLADLHRVTRLQTPRNSFTLLNEMYFQPTQGYLSAVDRFVTLNDLIDPPANKKLGSDDRRNIDKLKRASEVIAQLQGQVGRLMANAVYADPFPLAYVHGDLHCRNLMLAHVDRYEMQNPDFDFKLIDLEKFQTNGDIAMDIGELLADLEVTAIVLGQNLENRGEPIPAIMRSIKRIYTMTAVEPAPDDDNYEQLRRHDPTFPYRLNIARAWALLRFAKGVTRHGEQFLRESGHRDALREANRALEYASRAAVYFDHALNPSLPQPASD